MTRGGTYTVVVSNLLTSCVTILPIRVEDFQDSLATIVIAEPDSFDCNNPLIVIDASATELSTSGANNISWTSLTGGTVNPPAGELIVTVNNAGDYVLTIDNGADCSVSDTVTVAASASTPLCDCGPRSGDYLW